MEEILHQISEDSKVAIIAAPTLFCHILRKNPELASRCILFEYDNRFTVYGEGSKICFASSVIFLYHLFR